MSFIEGDDMVEQLSATASNPPFCDSILARSRQSLGRPVREVTINSSMWEVGCDKLLFYFPKPWRLT
jgi:hypothetical protein